jgi:hypothetical protein
MISLEDILVDLSKANTLEELKMQTQKVLSDLVANLQNQPRIVVLTDAAAPVPAGTRSGTIVFQLTESTTANPYGTISTAMYLKEERILIPST